MEFLPDIAKAHCTEYTNAAKLCTRKLAASYRDLGLSKEQQIVAWEQVAGTALRVWLEACEQRDVETQALRGQVRSCTCKNTRMLPHKQVMRVHACNFS